LRWAFLVLSGKNLIAYFGNICLNLYKFVVIPNRVNYPILRQPLGHTTMSPKDIQTIVDEMTTGLAIGGKFGQGRQRKFAPGQYTILRNNCQHFARAFAERLLRNKENRIPKIQWPTVLRPFGPLTEHQEVIDDLIRSLKEDGQNDLEWMGNQLKVDGKKQTKNKH
jgi:hypothetical protein